MAIPPTRQARTPLGLIGGDLAGFPNGRRVFDDVVTVELRAIAGVTYPLVNKSYTPDAAAALVTDGLGPNSTRYLPHFPYLGTPDRRVSDASRLRRRLSGILTQVTRATITGAVVGAGVPPAGSCVTMTALTPLRPPGTPTAADPFEVTANSVPVGVGVRVAALHPHLVDAPGGQLRQAMDDQVGAAAGDLQLGAAGRCLDQSRARPPALSATTRMTATRPQRRARRPRDDRTRRRTRRAVPAARGAGLGRRADLAQHPPAQVPRHLVADARRRQRVRDLLELGHFFAADGAVARCWRNASASAGSSAPSTYAAASVAARRASVRRSVPRHVSDLRRIAEDSAHLRQAQPHAALHGADRRSSIEAISLWVKPPK